MMKSIRTVSLIAAMYLALPVYLLTTNPNSLPLPLLMIPFLLCFATIFMTVLFVLRATNKSTSLFGRRAVGLAVITATLPTLLFILQSVHQLALKDVLIAGCFMLALVWYLSRLGILR